MEFLTEPTVHVLSVPHFFDHPQYKLPEGGTDSERLITHGGKGCYDSYGLDGRGVAEHLRAIISTRHGSVLEHANISLFLTGISRGCSHEIVRHRAGFAYSQRSTRYTREDDASFVLDPYYAILEDRVTAFGVSILSIDEAAILNQYKRVCKQALHEYSEAVAWLMEQAPREKNGVERRKWARGKARQLLPHALETRMTMTGNLRAWRFFLEERSGPFAEPEIRRLAAAVMGALVPHAPLVFKDMLDGMVVVDGYPHFKPEVPKV
jgi:thymidylate synthase (FAD)